MAKMIVTITKQPGEEWFDENFLTDEQKTIINPYNAMLRALPGFVDKYRENVSDDIKRVILEFDTPKNLTDALRVIHGSQQNEIAKKRNEFFRERELSSNTHYTFDLTYE